MVSESVGSIDKSSTLRSFNHTAKTPLIPSQEAVKLWWNALRVMHRSARIQTTREAVNESQKIYHRSWNRDRGISGRLRVIRTRRTAEKD